MYYHKMHKFISIPSSDPLMRVLKEIVVKYAQQVLQKDYEVNAEFLKETDNEKEEILDFQCKRDNLLDFCLRFNALMEDIEQNSKYKGESIYFSEDEYEDLREFLYTCSLYDEEFGNKFKKLIDKAFESIDDNGNSKTHFETIVAEEASF